MNEKCFTKLLSPVVFGRGTLSTDIRQTSPETFQLNIFEKYCITDKIKIIKNIKGLLFCGCVGWDYETIRKLLFMCVCVNKGKEINLENYIG